VKMQKATGRFELNPVLFRDLSVMRMTNGTEFFTALVHDIARYRLFLRFICLARRNRLFADIFISQI
jgi:hypothetical protein